MALVCEKGVSVESTSPPLFIGKPRGRIGTQKTQNAHANVTHEGHNGEAKELHGGASLAGHPLWDPPKMGSLVPKYFLLEA